MLPSICCPSLFTIINKQQVITNQSLITLFTYLHGWTVYLKLILFNPHSLSVKTSVLYSWHIWSHFIWMVPYRLSTNAKIINKLSFETLVK